MIEYYYIIKHYQMVLRIFEKGVPCNLDHAYHDRLLDDRHQWDPSNGTDSDHQ